MAAGASVTYLSDAARAAVRERRGLVFALAADGATVAEIGALIGVSRSRAGQILAAVEVAIFRAADLRFPVPKYVDWTAWRPLAGGDPRVPDEIYPARSLRAMPVARRPPPVDDGAPNPTLLGILREVFDRFGFTIGFRWLPGPLRVQAAAARGDDEPQVAEVQLVVNHRVLSLAEAVSAVVVECDRLNSIES
jgi:hypothetical protein